MLNLLIISDNSVFCDDLRLQIERYAPEYTINAEAATPDIVVLDEKPEMLTAIKAKHPQTPIFILLKKGADKPPASTFVKFEIKPIVLKDFINSLCSAINLALNSDDGRLKFNCYELRPLSKEIYNFRTKESTKLTEKEVAIVQYLYKIKGRIVTKTELLQEVWGYSPDVTTHTIETHIYRLRQKVEHDNPSSQLILTEDGGYLLKR